MKVRRSGLRWLVSTSPSKQAVGLYLLKVGRVSLLQQERGCAQQHPAADSNTQCLVPRMEDKINVCVTECVFCQLL